MSKFYVAAVPRYLRLVDVLMVPIMLLLRGLTSGPLQETHPWHVQRIDVKDLDLRLAIKSEGNDKTVYNGRYLFLFHAPMLGGWKNYSVYEVNRASVPFHIGWVARDTKTNHLIEASVHRLPVYEERVRMLDGPPSYTTYFFAVDQSGEQIPLHRVGRGMIGDGNHSGIRQF